MHIKQLRIQNFRCFEDVTIDFDDDVNVFVGNNGSGKSAVLDAVAGVLDLYIRRMVDSRFIDVSGFAIRETDLRIISGEVSEALEVVVDTTIGLSWTTALQKPAVYGLGHSPTYEKESVDDAIARIREYRQRFWDQDVLLPIELPPIASYRGTRFITDADDVSTVPRSDFPRLGSLEGALDAKSNYKDCLNWFYARELQELRVAKQKRDLSFQLPDLFHFRNAISSIVESASRVYFSEASMKPKLVVAWDSSTGVHETFQLSQLSDGYRNMLALVMDFARRMAQANPQMENPLEAEAILMIDEIDLHLHPTWQQRVIPDLKRAFPNTQIICTTHSPEVVSTVKGSQVKILEGNQVRDCPVPTEGMQSSDIVRHVLGLEHLRPPHNVIAEKVKALFDAIDARDLETAQTLRDELRAHDPQRYDSELIRADIGLRRLEHSRVK